MLTKLIAAAALVVALVGTAGPAQAARCYTLHVMYDNGIERTIKVCPTTLPSWGVGRR